MCLISGPSPNVMPPENQHNIHAVLEEPRIKRQQQPVPTSGPELAAMMKIGTRVQRGVDWKWGDQVWKLKFLCPLVQFLVQLHMY